MATKKKWKPVTLTHVDELVAEDWWEVRRNGKRFIVHLAVGRAAPDPSGQDWYCPVLLEGFPGISSRWRAIYGVFALDAMTNAFVFVSRFFHEYGPTPLGKPPRIKARSRRSSAARRPSRS